MSDEAISRAGERLQQALDTAEQQLSLLDARLASFMAVPSPQDSALVERHERLKTEVAAVIAELDSMVGPANASTAGQGDRRNG